MDVIYLITVKSSKTSGHGETADYTEIASKSGYGEDFYPFFTSREAAEKFLSNVGVLKPLYSITEIKGSHTQIKELIEINKKEENQPEGNLTMFSVFLFSPDGYFSPEDLKLIIYDGFRYRQGRGDFYRLSPIEVKQCK